ncbi:hypothetical protein [Burkholderia ubonensis]|uniref:hypothetical protein n=1 Tax=Burkholderia ubonensis TaxID=101571 RepID=UPI001E29BA69|nr:hypothetical protein [Burkholderia ubonensis]
MNSIAVVVASALAVAACNVEGVCRHPVSAYTFHVAETTAARIGVRKLLADDRRVRFFYVRMPSRTFFYGWALVGERLRSPVPTFRYANPVMRPPTPIGVGERAFNTNVGAAMRANALARPEQTESILKIIRAALRAAALAPFDRDALDVLGAALVCLADLSRVEVARV